MHISPTPSLSKPIVFISSQIGVFSKERKKIAKQIKEKLRWDVYLFEKTSRPYPPREVYKPAIEQSQVFLGIYGTEYGWIDTENGMDISGIHDEWCLATGYNKHRLAFIQNTKKIRDARLVTLIDKEINKDISSTPFDTPEELYEKVIESLDRLIGDYFFARREDYEKEIPNYSEGLTERYQSQSIIETSFIQEILYTAIKKHKKLYLYGEPGSGKTVALMFVSRNQQAIYISLRNRSLSYVLGYIANRILQLLGKNTCTYTSTDDALIKCEHLLRNNEIIIAVDDVDQNIDVAKPLLGLEVGKSKIIFAGRKYISDVDTVAIKCTGFTAEESAKYVLQVAPNSDSVLRKEAIGKSKGNPLYLAYYCSRYDQEPADSVSSYHERIYNQLSAASQEILAVLSICEILLDLDEAATAVSQYRGSTLTAIGLEKELSTIDFLVSVQNGTVAILHPAFREYVYNHLMNSGLAPSIHKAISEVYVEPYDFYFKAYHLVCAGEGDRIYDELPNAEIMAYQNGYVRIATKLFAEDILMAKSRNDLFRLGFAIYHTALVKKDRYGDLSGLRTATLAKKIFAKAQKPEWVRATESTIATFLVNLGRGYEAITMLKELVCHFRENGLIHQEAVVRTNLSYVYAKLGRVDELESECLEAKKLHESTGDMYGIAGCLLNLNNVYIARNKNDKILSTCREIQKLASKLGSPRLEAGAQNGLTAYYRRKKMYDEAKKAANSSISIAKDLNAWDLIALNYGNLGNVFRDEGNFYEAKKCHKKAEEIGRKIKSAYCIAHAKGRLAEISEDEKDEKTALRFGEQSIRLWDEIGNVYEGASEKCKLAERILRFAGFNWKDATNLYEEAINNYLSAGLVKDAYYSCRRLIDIHLEHLERVEAARIFHETLSRFATPDNSHYMSDLLEGLNEWDSRSVVYLDIVLILHNSLKCVSNSSTKVELFKLIRNIATAIKRFGSKIEDAYLILVENIINHYQKEKHEHYVTALALAIEQIPPNVEQELITKVFEKIGELNNDIFYRHEYWLDDQWYIFFNGTNAPIVDIRSGNSVNERVVAAVTAILLLREKTFLEKLIGHKAWKSIGWIIQTLSEQECRKHKKEAVSHLSKDWPVCLATVVGDNDKLEPYSAMLVSDTYLMQTDHSKVPENKCMIGLNLQLVDGFLTHFVGSTFSKRKKSNIRRKLITEVFDVTLEKRGS